MVGMLLLYYSRTNGKGSDKVAIGTVKEIVRRVE